MAEFTLNGKSLNRRGFLKGSALFAAGVGLSVASTAFAQGQAQGQEQKPATPEEEKDKAKQPSGDQAKQQQPSGGSGTAKEDPNKLVDANGREYRVCERCGGNMYQEGNTWTCEQCGLSYTE